MPDSRRCEVVGGWPSTVEVGQVYERVAMLNRDRTRFKITARDHTRIRIVSVPGGRRTAIRYVKVDPRPMGNGRKDRGVHTVLLSVLVRHYALVRGDAA
jgi:hypothetical protein